MLVHLVVVAIYARVSLDRSYGEGVARELADDWWRAAAGDALI
jgi:hypothetical protein